MKPLEGVTIADFTVHAAGPFCTHFLSQLGAKCIKIESALRPDIFRKPHAVYGRLGAATFDQVASNKLSVRINLKNPKGIELAKRLVAISDVAAQSFRPGVMKRLGLDYEVLKKIRPDLVMVSVSASGQTGPDKHFAGYAPLFGAWGGLGYMTGFSDGPPVEVRHVMDHSVGLNAAMATLAALYGRRNSGQGCHVDIAAREVSSSMIGEYMLLASAGQEVARMGNQDYRRAPHGLYPTNIEDRWLSIAVGEPAEWLGLVGVMGRPDLAADERFTTPQARHANQIALNEIVATWTQTQVAEDAAAALQNAGVPAHVSWTAADIVSDPHLRQRGAIVDVQEPDGSTRAAVGLPFGLSECPDVGIVRGTPELGEHEDYVFGELLGIGRAEYAELIEQQAIY